MAWRLSTSLTTDFCLDALEAAIRDCGRPTILNIDQGSTGTAFGGLVQQRGIQLSMEGKGSWRDNRFIFYNQGRPHTALDGQTPDMVYFALLPQREAS